MSDDVEYKLVDGAEADSCEGCAFFSNEWGANCDLERSVHCGDKIYVPLERDDAAIVREQVKGLTGSEMPIISMIDHPQHYNQHESGIEPIEIIKHESFNIGNVIKYCMRRKYKGKELEDLKKAATYLALEIEMVENK